MRSKGYARVEAPRERPASFSRQTSISREWMIEMGLRRARKASAGALWLIAMALMLVTARPSVAEEAAAGSTVDVLQLRPDVYMLTVAGINLALETGPDGTVIVNTGPPGTSAEVLAAVTRVSSQSIRFLVNTSADAELVGNNAQLAAAGSTLKDVAFGATGVAPGALGNYANIIAYQNVLTRMTA